MNSRILSFLNIRFLTNCGRRLANHQKLTQTENNPYIPSRDVKGAVNSLQYSWYSNVADGMLANSIPCRLIWLYTKKPNESQNSSLKPKVNLRLKSENFSPSSYSISSNAAKNIFIIKDKKKILKDERMLFSNSDYLILMR